MKTLLSSYCDAKELHVDEYGESFFQELVFLKKDGKISETDCIAIIDCLVAVDEIRILLASEIREFIAFFAETGDFSMEILELFRKISSIRGDEPERLFKRRMQSLIYDLLNNDLNIEQAIHSLEQN